MHFSKTILCKMNFYLAQTDVFYIRASPGGNENSDSPYGSRPKCVTISAPTETWHLLDIPDVKYVGRLPTHTSLRRNVKARRRIRLLAKYLLTPKADHLHHTKLRPTLG